MYTPVLKQEVSEAIAEQLSKLGLYYDNTIHKAMSEFNDKIVKLRNDQLKEYLKTNLERVGFKFNDDDELLGFCKKRLIRVAFAQKQNYYKLYVDYVDDSNQGTYLGSYHDTVEIINEGCKITVIMGRELTHPQMCPTGETCIKSSYCNDKGFCVRCD